MSLVFLSIFAFYFNYKQDRLKLTLIKIKVTHARQNIRLVSIFFSLFSFLAIFLLFLEKPPQLPLGPGQCRLLVRLELFIFASIFKLELIFLLLLVPSAFPQVCSFPCELRLDLGESKVQELVSGCRIN